MATIGLSIESGAMTAVLFDVEADAVVANQVTSLEGGVASSLPTAVEAMRAVAARRGIEVDAVGVVYRSADERDRFAAAVGESEMDGVQLVSASTAFLGWLARSPEFDGAECVLLYYIGASGVSLSLADAADASLSTPKTATLDSMSPERIGGTVPLAWEVLDEARRKPDLVALFGDRSSNQDLVDILALGIGVPVIRVCDADQIAARGAALAAAGDAELLEAPILGEHAETSSDRVNADVRPTLSRAPLAAVSVPVVSTVAEELPDRGVPRKKLVLAAAVLAGVLSGGVALASTLPGHSPESAAAGETSSAAATDIDTSLAGATQSVAIAQPAPPADPTSPVVIDPTTQLPVVDPGLVQEWTVDPTTGVARPAEALTPIPAASIPPAAAVVPRPTVEPPVFAVPTIVPEAGKSQEQLEQEAWDRHWQHTAQWLEQEIVGN